MDYQKVLIVGTVPYSKKSTSRAFESYFSGWDKNRLAQIFSNPETPLKGHCKYLYQITDKMLFRRWLSKRVTVGKKYFYEKLETDDNSSNIEERNVFAKKLYSLGSAHTPLTHIMRKILWRKKFWYTKQITDWIESFKPQCVFLSFSNDFFILEIAQNVSKKYNIPIIFAIGDDYFFNNKFSISPLYHLYRSKYKKLVRKLFIENKYAIYISDKIKEKYNKEFGLIGETVYLTSELQRREFKKIDTKNPCINYFGNILLDRYLSLIDIAEALKEIDSNYVINVYSGRITKRIEKKFSDCGNIFYHGSISYNEVNEKTLESDILILVEGFTKTNINATKYSLSTKVADSLKSGSNIFAYGSEKCGLIDYLTSYDACFVCVNPNDLHERLKSLITIENLQKKYYERSILITENHHDIFRSTELSKSIIQRAIKNCY